MRKFVGAAGGAAAALGLLIAPAARAADQRPITDRSPDAMDVAKTPVNDLNLDQRKIPQLLIEAETRPYDRDGLNNCTSITAAVDALDDILGPDLDLPQEERDRISATRVAKYVVASFIPFRSLVREVSGARKHDDEVTAAIQAGLARRGFLKGLGEARHCAYPASPATPKVIAAYKAKFEKEDREKAAKKAKAEQADAAKNEERKARSPS
ncbi:hypothetical protein [Novosphingobium sp. 9]|uniref:hypothetical protein n=1 Tax=Novosphingobium sp. 9 TaxID=2025349 RepID=UPI0021B6D238|nr:hypothetical protein [Novosphingobium sp. 9]